MDGERPHELKESHRAEWRPRPSMAGRTAVAAALLAAAFSAAGWAYVVGRPVALDSFLGALIGLAGCLLVVLLVAFARGHYALAYHLSDHELSLQWPWMGDVVPLARIDGVLSGHRLGKLVGFDGISWRGHHVGTARFENFPRVKYYGTSLNPEHVVMVTASEEVYALTPADLSGFRSALISQLEELPEEDLEEAPPVAATAARLLQLSLWGDRMALALLAVGLVVMLGSFGYVAARFPSLPDLMPLHYGFTGEPDVIGPPRDAFRMPIIAMILLGANGVLVAALHLWRRDAARLLAGATVFVQVVMLVAVLRVVH